MEQFNLKPTVATEKEPKTFEEAYENDSAFRAEVDQEIAPFIEQIKKALEQIKETTPPSERVINAAKEEAKQDILNIIASHASDKSSLIEKLKQFHKEIVVGKDTVRFDYNSFRDQIDQLIKWVEKRENFYTKHYGA